MAEKNQNQALVKALLSLTAPKIDNSKMANQLKGFPQGMGSKQGVYKLPADYNVKNEIKDAALFANSFMPITGDIQSGVMAAQDFAKGNYGSAALNAIGMLPFVAGTFVGTKGIDNLGLGEVLNHAKKLKEAKVPDEQIWSETSKMVADRGVPGGGITFKFGNKPNLEIDDSMAKVNPMNQTDWNYAPLPSILEHPNLYKAEPALKGVAISPTDKPYSYMDVTRRDMGIAPEHRIDEKLFDEYGGHKTVYNFTPDVIGHEAQHYIQTAHGLPEGGNQNTQKFLNEVFEKTKQEYMPALSNIEQAKPELNELYRQKRIQDLVRILNKSSYKPNDLYRSADFYKHSDEIRSSLGQMPKKPGYDRDSYIRNAYDIIYKNYITEKQIPSSLVETALSKKPSQVNYQINKMYKKLDPDYKKAQEFSEIRNKNEQINALSPYQVYNNLTGEAQSRLVQNRWDMTPQQRAENYPFTKEQLKMSPYDLIDVRYK